MVMNMVFVSFSVLCGEQSIRPIALHDITLMVT